LCVYGKKYFSFNNKIKRDKSAIYKNL